MKVSLGGQCTHCTMELPPRGQHLAGPQSAGEESRERRADDTFYDNSEWPQTGGPAVGATQALAN